MLVGGVVGGFEEVLVEIVNSYEVGFKGDFFGDILSFELVVYYYVYKNF